MHQRAMSGHGKFDERSHYELKYYMTEDLKRQSIQEMKEQTLIKEQRRKASLQNVKLIAPSNKSSNLETNSDI